VEVINSIEYQVNGLEDWHSVREQAGMDGLAPTVHFFFHVGELLNGSSLTKL